MAVLSIVVGGASGIGAETVRKLVARGDNVIGVDLNRGEDLKDVEWIVGDAGSQDTWDSVEETLRKRNQPVTNLVYGAAYLAIGNVLELSIDDWRQTFEVNLLGMVRAAKCVLPGMIANGGGSIVTVGSIDSYMAEQGLLAYCTSKGGVAQFSKTLALDHARDGVRVNCVCPGVTDTPLLRRHLNSASDPEKFLHVREERNPLGRLLKPEEIAETIAFLASPASSGMTGAVVVVDAGLTAGFDFRTGKEGA